MPQPTVVGIYASPPEADAVRRRLLAASLPEERIRVVGRVRAGDRARLPGEADGVLKDVLIDTAIGTLVGTALGALGEAILASANLTLLTASPVVAPLAMLGWGAAAGALVGGAAGANGANWRGRWPDIVLYAIRRGHVTLIAEPRDAAERQRVRHIIGPSEVFASERRGGAAGQAEPWR